MPDGAACPALRCGATLLGENTCAGGAGPHTLRAWRRTPTRIGL